MIPRGAKTGDDLVDPFPIPAPYSKFPSALHADLSHQAHSAHNCRRKAERLRAEADDAEREASAYDELAWKIQAEIDAMCMKCEGSPCIRCAGSGWKASG